MNRIVCLVLAVILSAACSLKEIDAPEYVNESGESVFYAEIESPAESTKAYADASLKVLWDADDRVSIFNKDTYNQQYVFNGQTGDNAGGFDIVQSGGFVTANDIAHVYAVYPYNASTKISNDEVLTLNLPARQTWREGTFGKGASTMIAVSSGNKLKFKNLPSYLAVRLYGDDVRVSSVELQGNNGESLSGECTVTMSEGGVPQVTMNTEGSGIIVECDSPVLIGDSQNNYTEFWFALPPTNFRAGFTVTVTVDDGGKFTKTTEKTINLQRNVVSRMVPFEVKTVPVPEAIDLGLSVKWASFNVGASKPEEYGDYYAWGEIETKESYIWPTNKWSNGDSERLIKYCTDASCWDGSGQMDYKTILDIEDDVANLLLGDNWRMASLDEWIELQDNCTWTWTNNYKGTGVAGRIGTSNKEGYTDKTIFLPAAGGRDGVLSNVGKDCNFWSSTLARDHSYNACGFMLNESGICSYNYYRYAGLSIRAVNGEVVPVSCISVPAAMDLYLGKTETITATVLPADATYGNLTWTSSDESVVKVDNSGQVTAVSVGRATITVYSADASKTAECEVTVSPEAIDLGLSVKWASCNLGASKPDGYGDYFAWGEIEPRDSFNSWQNYKWCAGSYSKLTKYCWYDGYGNNGYIDFKKYLDLEDDAAFQIYGDNWRTPTKQEFQELAEACDWTLTSINGVSGYEVKSKVNRNTIFLPFSGYYTQGNVLVGANSDCFYWSSYSSDYNGVDGLTINSDGHNLIDRIARCEGCSIRPVKGDYVHVTGITLSKSEVTVKLGDSVYLSALIEPENASNKSFSWASDSESVLRFDSYYTRFDAVAEGVATVTVRSIDGGHTASCRVTIVP